MKIAQQLVNSHTEGVQLCYMAGQAGQNQFSGALSAAELYEI